MRRGKIGIVISFVEHLEVDKIQQSTLPGALGVLVVTVY